MADLETKKKTTAGDTGGPTGGSDITSGAGDPLPGETRGTAEWLLCDTSLRQILPVAAQVGGGLVRGLPAAVAAGAATEASLQIKCEGEIQPAALLLAGATSLIGGGTARALAGAAENLAVNVAVRTGSTAAGVTARAIVEGGGAGAASNTARQSIDLLSGEQQQFEVGELAKATFAGVLVSGVVRGGGAAVDGVRAQIPVTLERWQRGYFRQPGKTYEVQGSVTAAGGGQSYHHSYVSTSSNDAGRAVVETQALSSIHRGTLPSSPQDVAGYAMTIQKTPFDKDVIRIGSNDPGVISYLHHLANQVASTASAYRARIAVEKWLSDNGIQYLPA